jgi:hypothetical protein
MQNDDDIYSSDPALPHLEGPRRSAGGIDGFELALQLQRLVLRSSPPEDQHDAGRADEQHER